LNCSDCRKDIAENKEDIKEIRNELKEGSQRFGELETKEAVQQEQLNTLILGVKDIKNMMGWIVKTIVGATITGTVGLIVFLVQSGI